MKTVAIMQPTFLPWLGYFALIDHVDTFVYLDDVQLSRQSWQSRNRIVGPDGVLWLTLPLRRKPARPAIADARLAEGDASDKLLRTLAHALSWAPHRDLVVDIARDAFERADGNLSSLNRAIIDAVCDVSAITTPRQVVGSVKAPNSGRSDRLIAVTQALEGSVYVSPPSAADYLAQDNGFTRADVALRFFNYAHPLYPQRAEVFTPYMSAMEALAAVGPEAFGDLARSGIGPDLTLEDLQSEDSTS